jgi:hypothetical protein
MGRYVLIPQIARCMQTLLDFCFGRLNQHPKKPKKLELNFKTEQSRSAAFEKRIRMECA